MKFIVDDTVKILTRSSSKTTNKRRISSLVSHHYFMFNKVISIEYTKSFTYSEQNIYFVIFTGDEV